MVFRKSHAAESVIPFARGNITLVVTGVAGSVHLEHPGGFAVRQQTDAAGPLGQIEIVLVVGDQQTGGVEARGEQRTEIMLPRDTGASGKGRNVGFDGVGEEGFESLFIELQIPPPAATAQSDTYFTRSAFVGNDGRDGRIGDAGDLGRGRVDEYCDARGIGTEIAAGDGYDVARLSPFG